MKNILILSVLALGLVGCETYNRVPYTGGVGEYGFTYDLDSSPSPFSDTSYQPLSPYELAAPIIVVVTNQPPERYSIERPLIAPSSPDQISAGSPSVAPSPVIIESAGTPVSPGVIGTTPANARVGSVAPGYVEGSENVILPSGDVNNFDNSTNLTSTNITAANVTNVINATTNVTNTTNAYSSITNTNSFGGITNTNAFAGGTNRQIYEPAGTQLQTNQQPPTPFQTNSINEPSGAPPPTQTNAAPDSLTNQQPPTVRPPPPQRPSEPPASAPQNPPAPVTP